MTEELDKALDRVCILPRLSLSELLHISGLVRSVCGRASDVILVAHRDHVRSIRNMYDGIPNLTFKLVTRYTHAMLDSVEQQGYHIVPLQTFRSVCPYAVMGLDPLLAYSQFVTHRLLENERELHDIICADVGPVYAVVHDDESRKIRKDLLPQGIPIVSVRDPKYRRGSIFDWVQTIDHAVQFHGIDSCFAMMADMLALRARKFVYCEDHSSYKYKDVVPILG